MNRTIEKIKKSNLAIFFGIFLFVLSSLLTIYQGSKLIIESYISTIGQKGLLLTNLNKISAGQNFDYFKSILGSPAFTNDVTKEFKEHIFVYKYCFVQVVVNNSSNVVVMYAITTRQKNFNPKIKIWNGSDKYVTISLGESKFIEIDSIFNFTTTPEYPELSDKIYANLGAHDNFYLEKYWGANPGNYQTYLFASNMSGYENWVEEELIPPYDDKDPGIKDFRNKAVINTFAITAPNISVEKFGFIDGLNGLQIGPDYYQVRILPDFN